jgi:hypothetical protein
MNAAHYDGGLPILAELAEAFERELQSPPAPPGVRCAGDEPSPRAPKPPAQSSSRLGWPVRVTRRALVLVALVSLVGASALAGRFVSGGGSQEPGSRPAPLSAGGSGRERWQLEAYRHGGAVCHALFVADTVASACTSTLEPTSVQVISALSPTRRFVAGIAGAGVGQVLVRVGRAALALPTYPPPAAAGAHRAELPVGLRWFVAILPAAGGVTNAAPALLTPRDRRGRGLGGAVLDCSLGASSALCRQAASHIAAGSGAG